MSLSRAGHAGKWFGSEPGYVYVTGRRVGNYNEFNTAIREVETFCELAMRALAQSGELDDETLADCQQALATRFDYVDMEVKDDD